MTRDEPLEMTAWQTLNQGGSLFQQAWRLNRLMNQCFRPPIPERTHQSPINNGQVRECSSLSTDKFPIVALQVLFLSGKLLYLVETGVSPHDLMVLHQNPRGKISSTNILLKICGCVYFIFWNQFLSFNGQFYF